MSSASWAREEEDLPVTIAWSAVRERIESGLTPAEVYELMSGEPEVGPGQVCPTCGEKTPSERALKMREWRAKRAAD